MIDSRGNYLSLDFEIRAFSARFRNSGLPTLLMQSIIFVTHTNAHRVYAEICHFNPRDLTFHVRRKKLAV